MINNYDQFLQVHPWLKEKLFRLTKKVPFSMSMAMGIVELVHKYFPKHLSMHGNTNNKTRQRNSRKK